nr:reverse transcriptase domain-containing protein [Tanacetum cinerariifolium]
MMDTKISTFAERQAKNKIKFKDTSKNNQNQQQNKKQNTARAYVAGSGDKKPYKGSKPLCSKCNYHHAGQCALKCHKYNRVGHLACECKSTTNANNANNQRGTRAGLVGYYRRFIEGFLKIAKSMIKHTQKGVKFDWGDKSEAAFQLIKQKLHSAPILALPKGSKDFVVYCDASYKVSHPAKAETQGVTRMDIITIQWSLYRGTKMH